MPPTRLSQLGLPCRPKDTACGGSGSDSSTGDETWYAEGMFGRFVANSTVELLGLVAMRELRGAGWKADDQQIESFMRNYHA